MIKIINKKVAANNFIENRDSIVTVSIESFCTIFSRNIPTITLQTAEAVVRGRFVEKLFLEISQNSKENTCARVSFLIKLQALGLKPY